MLSFAIKITDKKRKKSTAVMQNLDTTGNITLLIQSANQQ